MPATEGLSAEQLAEVIRLLKAMDAQQIKTDEIGDREIAWYYWRDEVAEALGISVMDSWQGLNDD